MGLYRTLQCTTSFKGMKRIIRIPMWKTKGSPLLRMEGDVTYQMSLVTVAIKEGTTPTHRNAQIIMEATAVPMVLVTHQVEKE